MKQYLDMFINEGITGFDFYTSTLESNSNKLSELIDYLNINNIKITMHYNGIDDLNSYKKTLTKIRNNLLNKNINYQIPIVFHIPKYEHDKYKHMNEMISIFKELTIYSKKLKFDILIETLSKNHPIGNHIGDDISEIKVFLDNIMYDNFGICWDTGHTRLNNIEAGSNLLLDKNILKRVKHTHIHNIVWQNEYIDHLPITNTNLQDDEIKYLIENNYDGFFSIEFEIKNLKENIYVYLDSIKKIKNLIEGEIV